MIIRDINPGDKAAFNRKADHPLQSYDWGEFREKTGVRVVRKAIFAGNQLIMPIQVTIHQIPKLNWQLGYFPKGPMPDETQLKVLKQIGEENGCVFIKLEPNVLRSSAAETIDKFLLDRGCQKGRPLFTQYSFRLDLTLSEDRILSRMHSKTRYNFRLAERKGVKVKLDNSPASFAWFLKLLFEQTLARQGFYAHTPEYFKKLWQTLSPTGMARLLRAEYNQETLAVFMVFVFNDQIYYPYGASTRKYKELMAPNLLMWEVIKLGKKLGCKALDLWGALGPKPDEADPWYGFHRFKQGYGGELVEFVGSFDLVLQPNLYRLCRLAEEGRWQALRAKAKLKQLPFKAKTKFRSVFNQMAQVFE